MSQQHDVSRRNERKKNQTIAGTVESLMCRNRTKLSAKQNVRKMKEREQAAMNEKKKRRFCHNTQTK